MKENMLTYTYAVEAQVTADGILKWQTPRQLDIVHVSLCAEAFTGAPTGFNIDIQVATADVITAVAANTAGTPGTWSSKDVGGTQDPVHVAAGANIEVDFNLVAGTAPTADATIVIMALLGE